MVIRQSPNKNRNPKNKNHHPGLVDGLKSLGDAVLGRHHPPVAPLTGTGIIRTTIESTIRAFLCPEKIRWFVIGRQSICLRHPK